MTWKTTEERFWYYVWVRLKFGLVRRSRSDEDYNTSEEDVNGWSTENRRNDLWGGVTYTLSAREVPTDCHGRTALWPDPRGLYLA